MNSDVSLDRARELLSYDPDTGHLRWRKTMGRGHRGCQAGHIFDRYRRITIDGVLYPAHRLGWFIYHGRWPLDQLDHINGDPDDNRIANLREVTPSENSRNRRLRSDNSSGAPGVYFYRPTNRWYAQSCHEGKNRHLGFFDSFDEAVEARRTFQEIHGYHPNHGRAA